MIVSHMPGPCNLSVVVVANRVTGDDLFDGSTLEEVSQMVSSLQFCVDQSCLRELSAECNDFVFQRAVVMNPRRRLSAPQCLRHRWLQLTSLARSRRLSSSHDLLTSPTKYFPSKMHVRAYVCVCVCVCVCECVCVY